MKIDLQKGSEQVGNVIGKAAEIGKKAADGTFTGAQALITKAQEENQKSLVKKYNPVFPEQYKSEDFAIPNLVMIVDDAIRRDVDVCKGAIGWRSNQKGVEIFCLYDEAIVFSGLHFIPAAVCDSVCYPDLYNHKLDTLCEYLQLDLDHHNAGSDSRACAELLLDYMRHGLKPEHFLRRYDLAQRRTLRTPPKAQPSETTTQLLELKDLLGAVTADNELKKEEVLFLQKWMDRNTALRGNFPFDKIFETVGAALEDGILEKSELNSMLRLFEQITDPVAKRN